jgi:hypothetical protein
MIASLPSFCWKIFKSLLRDIWKVPLFYRCRNARNKSENFAQVAGSMNFYVEKIG